MSLPEGQETAVAVLVAPERMQDAIAALPPDRLVPFLWWIDQLIQRAHAAKKAALIEAAVALSRMELDPRLEVNGHHYQLREDHRIVWKELGPLLGMLEAVHGIPGDELRAAVSEVKVTMLRAAAEKIADRDLRADALNSIEDARVRVPAPLALVDLDDPWRTRR